MGDPKNIFHKLFQFSAFRNPFFSDSARKWAVKGWLDKWRRPAKLLSTRLATTPSSLTAVWTPKTFQTNSPFPHTLLPARDVQSGRDFQCLLCSGNIERHWRDKLLGDDGKTLITQLFSFSGYQHIDRCCNLSHLLGELKLSYFFNRSSFIFKSEPIWNLDFWSEFDYNLIPTELVLIGKRLWRGGISSIFNFCKLGPHFQILEGKCFSEYLKLIFPQLSQMAFLLNWGSLKVWFGREQGCCFRTRMFS